MSDNNKETEDSASVEEIEEASSASVEVNFSEELEKAKKLAEENNNKYLRAMADFENFRRRVIREKEDLRKNAAAGMIEELLPIIDNLALGLNAAYNNKEAKNIVDGFKMVYDQLKAILAQNGAKEINPEGGDFDPNLHECVSHVYSNEVDENKVVEVIRVGYALNERLIRPAFVVVSKGKESEDKEE